MRKNEYYWLAGYACAAMIFSYGACLWRQAAYYTPVAPEAAPVNHYTFARANRNLPLSRYSRLLQGELFFEKPTPTPPALPLPKPELEFHSNLKIFGLIKGRNPRAVVGMEGVAQTWIVKPGSAVGGERVVAIGAKYLVVRNASGEGKIFYQN